MHSPDDSNVPPQVSTAVAQTGKVLFTCNKSSADGSTAHAGTSLIDSVAIASSIGDKIRTNAGDDLSSKLIRQQCVVCVCERINPVNPSATSARSSHDSIKSKHTKQTKDAFQVSVSCIQHTTVNRVQEHQQSSLHRRNSSNQHQLL
jgi:hypothetical protein